VLPDPAKATGAAVVVAPGGAFMLLAMDHEGWGVARALADRNRCLRAEIPSVAHRAMKVKLATT
jgi:hypothetical protein